MPSCAAKFAPGTPEITNKTEYTGVHYGRIKQVRQTGVDKKSFYACYITQNRKLIGRLSVKDLLLAENDDVLIDSLMKTNVISVNTHDDQEEVSKLLSKYNFYAIPVVDSEERMVGIIAFDDFCNFYWNDYYKF